MQATPMFGRWIKRRRADLDMTQELLAEQVGCSIESVRAFETGRRRPSRAMGERLAQVLHIDPAQYEEFLRIARSSTPHAHDGPAAHAATSEPRRNSHTTSPPATHHCTPLPIPPTLFIGRTREVAEVTRGLTQSGHRLLTLMGAGGAGKTRLALQAAAELADHFADGVAFVALAQVMAVENVAAAIADAVGCPLVANQSPEESLLAFLRKRELLLVLDNLEHLLGSASIVVAILRQAVGVRLLITSRERLRLQCEHSLELGGLAIPHDDSRAAIDHADSVRLFVERSRQVRSDFRLTPSNRKAIAELCRLLDGTPLGIELAAAWVRVLEPDEIVAEVQRSMDFLTLSDRDADPRHHSMRAAITHSWSLLSPEERRVLARLAVVRGGCSREAAQQITGATLPILASLLDKSLLRRSATGRYEIHELVRQYSADRLAADPDDAAATRDRHSAYYAAWIASRKSRLQGPQQHEAVLEITVEIDNLRSAWQHAVAQRNIELLWTMTDGTVLTWFYELRSWYREAEALTRSAVEALGRLPLKSRQEEILLASLLGNQGWHTFRCGQPEEGVRLLQQSLKLLRAGDHPAFLFISLEQLAYLVLFTGDFEQAIRLVEEQAPIVEQLTDPWLLAHARFQRAVVYVDRAPAIAYQRFHDGLLYMRAVGDRYVVILSLCHVGEIALALGKVDEAELSFAEARELSTGISNRIGEAGALSGLAMVASARGALREAVAYGLEAVTHAREIGDTWTLAKALLALGVAEAGAGDPAAARSSLSESLIVSLAAHAMPTALDAWLGLAELDVAHGTISQMLLAILAVARRSETIRPIAAERAAQLWTRLAAEVNPQSLGNAEAEMEGYPPAQLAQLLREDVEERGGTAQDMGALVAAAG